MANDDFDKLLDTMKRAGAALRDAGIPFALTGGLAVWARGGPRTEHDVDFLVKPEDAERAQQALVGTGMRGERPAEGWLLNAYDDGILIDLIYEPSGRTVDDAMFARAEELDVNSVRMRVASLEDVLETKLLSLGEQNLDYSPLLGITRALREQIDWGELRAATAHAPYARPFFTLVEGLGIVSPGPDVALPRIRRVG